MSLNNLVFLETVVKMPLMDLPVRSTFVRLQKGGVLLSPGSRLSEEQLRSISGVTDIVGTNLFHCAGMKKSAAFYSTAKKWGPLGAEQAKPEIKWDATLSESTWPYQDELIMIQIDGMPKVNEVVFIHKESKSLIVSDLCFNMTQTKGFGAWLILSLFGTYRKFGVSKFLMKFAKDKTLAEKSFKKLLSYDFDNIIVGHGENIIGRAKPLLQAALQKRGFNID